MGDITDGVEEPELPDPRSSSVGAMFIPAGEEARPSGEA